MQTHKALVAPPETHDTRHSTDKTISWCPHRQPSDMNVYAYTTHRYRHRGWPAETRAPEKTQREETDRQGKLRIPPGKRVPLLPRPAALTACPYQDSHILVSLCSSQKGQAQGAQSASYPLPSQDRGCGAEWSPRDGLPSQSCCQLHSDDLEDWL